MIGLVGLDHLEARAEVRGRLAFAEERLPAALRTLAATPRIAGVAVLSTCNRTEVYLSTSDWTAARAAVLRFLGQVYARALPLGVAAPALADGTGVGRAAEDAIEGEPAGAADTSAELERMLYSYEGAAAARHLFQVAAGLRSMVVGEAQILGQVKDALLVAERTGTLDEDVRAVFTQALKVGKRVRTQTGIGRADASVAEVAMRVASRALKGLAGKSVLLIGAGRTSQLCAELARQEGAARLVFANRTPSVAAEVARQIGGESLPLAEIGARLGEVDLVASATAAPHLILTTEIVAPALARRTTPLVILDLAVPPDVEPAVGLLPAVTLYSLDSLRAAAEPDDLAATSGRETEHAHAERLVDAGVQDYVRAQTIRLAGPGITALRRHVDRSAQAELERALTRLEHLSEADREVVAQLSQRLVGKMFHHLVARVRSLAEYDEVPPQITMQVLARLLADPEQPSPHGREEPGSR